MSALVLLNLLNELVKVINWEAWHFISFLQQV